MAASIPVLTNASRNLLTKRWTSSALLFWPRNIFQNDNLSSTIYIPVEPLWFDGDKIKPKIPKYRTHILTFGLVYSLHVWLQDNWIICNFAAKKTWKNQLCISTVLYGDRLTRQHRSYFRWRQGAHGIVASFALFMASNDSACHLCQKLRAT